MSKPCIKNSIRFGLLSAAALMGVTVSANAAGFFIQEQSVRGLGAAFSGATTTLNDPSTIFFNPAGMTNLDGVQQQMGVNLLIPRSQLTNRGSTIPLGGAGANIDGGNPYDPTPVPNGFMSYQINDRLWAGLGVTAPFGLASDYGTTWFGRYDSTSTKLEIFDIQPTIAYKVNDMLSIGAGVNIQHSDANLQARVTNGATEGDNRLTGDDWGFGYSIGLQLKPTNATTIGLNYKSEVHHKMEGRIQVTGVAGLNENSPGFAKLTTPDHLTLGVAHKVTNRLTLQGQTSWYGWNNFQSIRAVRNTGTVANDVQQNYQTTLAFAAGAEYLLNDQWLLRGGMQFDETPTTDEFRSSRTPDGDRTWASIGATYKITPQINLDMAGTYIHIDSETINVVRNGGLARVIADTEGDVGILALGLTYKF